MSILADLGQDKEMALPLAGQMRRRRIDAKTGRALVVLGHAIDHLADEYIFVAGSKNSDRSQLEAIRLLMAKNREIYFACPEVPKFSQALISLFHPKSRQSAGSELSQSRV